MRRGGIFYLDLLLTWSVRGLLVLMFAAVAMLFVQACAESAGSNP